MIYDKINWDELIDSLSLQQGTEVTTDPSYWDPENHNYSEIYSKWKEARFNESAIKWINYYPIKNYDENIEHSLAAYCGVRPIRSWISRIDPGYFAPWHWDIDDQLEEYKKLGDLFRYICFIDKPHMGHIFILGDKYYYDMEQGTLIEWGNYLEWHCGINGGLSPKYMFNLLGYRDPVR
jgi:hypothetical protein